MIAQSTGAIRNFDTPPAFPPARPVLTIGSVQPRLEEWQAFAARHRKAIKPAAKRISLQFAKTIRQSGDVAMIASSAARHLQSSAAVDVKLLARLAYS